MEAVAKSRLPDGAALQVLHGHARLIGWQVANNRASLALKLLTAAAGVAVAFAVGFGVWRASQAQGLVIDPFSVPPAMAERGLDGAAVAALFLDELSLLQAQTDSGRAPSSYRNNWGEDLSVEIAQTGVSVGDVYQLMVSWLGNETRMTGGVSQGPDGLSIIVRTGSTPIEAATGAESELRSLLRLAAERVYEQTQPYRYATLLTRRARTAPAGAERDALRAHSRSILQSLTTSPSPVDRAWAFNGLGVMEDRTLDQLLPLLRAGLEVDPNHAFITGNMAIFEESLGHHEAAVDWSRRSIAALERRPRDLNPAVIAANLSGTNADVARLTGDYRRAASLNGEQARAASANNSAVTAPFAQAEVYSAAHDPAAAEGILRTLEVTDDADVTRRTGARTLILPFAAIAAERQQWSGAVALLEGADATFTSLATPRELVRRRTSLWPQLAYARARVGDLAGAVALINETPTDCYLCVRERARIAELAGDRAGADRWLLEAMRQGPTLPFAHQDRGIIRFARGDLDGALADVQEAHRRSPNWADPLKSWGDIESARGDARSALRRYAQAAEHAPTWGALHVAWGSALSAAGKPQEAQERFNAAARMDLTAANRDALNRLLRAVKPSGG